MARVGSEKAAMGEGRLTGTYVAYSYDASELWRSEEPFVVGTSKVPTGVAAGMWAMQIFGAKGEVIRKWNPWKIDLSKTSL